MSGWRVAVRVDGDVTVHMAGTVGDYDTICGLDANDIQVGHEPATVPKGGRARIDCDACWAIWNTARSYTRKDFVSRLGEAQ